MARFALQALDGDSVGGAVCGHSSAKRTRSASTCCLRDATFSSPKGYNAPKRSAPLQKKHVNAKLVTPVNESHVCVLNRLCLLSRLLAQAANLRTLLQKKSHEERRPPSATKTTVTFRIEQNIQ